MLMTRLFLFGFPLRCQRSLVIALVSCRCIWNRRSSVDRDRLVMYLYRRCITSWKGLNLIIPCKTRDFMASIIIAANMKRDWRVCVWHRHGVSMCVLRIKARTYGCIWRRRSMVTAVLAANIRRDWHVWCRPEVSTCVLRIITRTYGSIWHRCSMVSAVLAANIRRDWRVCARRVVTVSMCMSIIEAKTRYGCIWRGGSMVAAVLAANIRRV